MYNPDREYFFFVFFFITVPCVIAACNPGLNISIWVRLTAISAFLFGLFVIIRESFLEYQSIKYLCFKYILNRWLYIYSYVAI